MCMSALEEILYVDVESVILWYGCWVELGKTDMRQRINGRL